ncbi:methionine--tRNA ligase [candidate division WWE3 bacterium RIFOXYC1_FULL_40_10]|uniref:Methionine--tRNA ligase n=1 Tax=candidate division WWE3 bacterium RIFOXYA2_FULL_46_9 TaxID=1802636 RepID=A0A1F4W1K8_UNCKA|nr:MAG: methionine--tRNA ligase [candidate division WWE3 bacterium RIFOXYB1_FULL_40_22]OGC62016.1 MAG: methionine--tRNA ligase [candidate division WWE3 bacterium RIFOXYA1_FULL_40_11]OGC62933.1 MAG: methionine--tRNA ligase [candidate division WWE3 bacterium RIFOXYA2_FULL_46_9]OGC65039.1 MAG: methionine--tRNA ligase [candidate division WWE3 bacterium RIFOXYB2_FULL_41_6]OGC66399.1 MAG: methionine--tRNA ligase [candidate division WWE3 bacterium RIFOXYC1_FULL_40_10]OGC68001.1 MAG: methionine--tRNA 
MKKLFITTAIDYTNGVIHIGHAYEKILADSYARYQRKKLGDSNVLFTTGTDEHGTTSQKAAEKRGLTPLQHVTEISNLDQEQIDALNISYTRFIRTTDEDHKAKAEEFFQKAYAAGDIYKATYKGFYCEGCEAHKTLSELDEKGQCPNHPSRQIQELDEENYFFKWSKYQGFLKNLIESNELEIKPEGKRKEMLAFLESGLKDITVSRPKYKVSWGIQTPVDSAQVIYVWFDALINYVTEGLPKGFWDEDTEIVHFVGKDIARWHTLLWPAMLKSVGYRLPNKVYVHGFVNLNGRKISKSLGNIILPTELVQKYGVDAVRYYLLKQGPIVEDSDISEESLKEVYNSDLANGLGNTVARIAKMAEKSGFVFNDLPSIPSDDYPFEKDFRVDLVLAHLKELLGNLDKHINENEPWKIEDEEKLKAVLIYEVGEITRIAKLYEPFVPNTSNKIIAQFSNSHIKAQEGLFPKIK